MRTYVNQKNEPEGVGIICSLDGKSIKEISEYKGGLRHGIGRVREEQSGTYSEYSGEMHEGQNHGFGTLRIFKDENETPIAIYKGQWLNHQRNGYGVEVRTNGTTYQGGWLNNKKSGFGRMVYSNEKITYDGPWANNKKQGRGTIIT